MTGLEFAARVGGAARQPAAWVQLLKFSLVGGSGYLVNLAVFDLLLTVAGAPRLAAAIAAFCIAVTNNFLLNRYWTFGPGKGAATIQATRFLVVSVASLAINLLALEMLVVGAGLNDLGAQALSVAIAMPFNFAGNKLWTFS